MEIHVFNLCAIRSADVSRCWVHLTGFSEMVSAGNESIFFDANHLGESGKMNPAPTNVNTANGTEVKNMDLHPPSSPTY
jgi:hypothetical protein